MNAAAQAVATAMTEGVPHPVPRSGPVCPEERPHSLDDQWPDKGVVGGVRAPEPADGGPEGQRDEVVGGESRVGGVEQPGTRKSGGAFGHGLIGASCMAKSSGCGR